MPGETENQFSLTRASAQYGRAREKQILISNPICVGLVGINYAESYTSYEGERPWPTDDERFGA
jgi:hypothetical protein